MSRFTYTIQQEDINPTTDNLDVYFTYHKLSFFIVEAFRYKLWNWTINKENRCGSVLRPRIYDIGYSVVKDGEKEKKKKKMKRMKYSSLR